MAVGKPDTGLEKQPLNADQKHVPRNEAKKPLDNAAARQCPRETKKAMDSSFGKMPGKGLSMPPDRFDRNMYPSSRQDAALLPATHDRRTAAEGNTSTRQPPGPFPGGVLPPTIRIESGNQSAPLKLTADAGRNEHAPIDRMDHPVAGEGPRAVPGQSPGLQGPSASAPCKVTTGDKTQPRPARPLDTAGRGIRPAHVPPQVGKAGGQENSGKQAQNGADHRLAVQKPANRATVKAPQGGEVRNAPSTGNPAPGKACVAAGISTGPVEPTMPGRSRPATGRNTEPASPGKEKGACRAMPRAGHGNVMSGTALPGTAGKHAALPARDGNAIIRHSDRIVWTGTSGGSPVLPQTVPPVATGRNGQPAEVNVAGSASDDVRIPAVPGLPHDKLDAARTKVKTRTAAKTRLGRDDEPVVNAYAQPALFDPRIIPITLVDQRRREPAFDARQESVDMEVEAVSSRRIGWSAPEMKDFSSQTPADPFTGPYLPNGG